MNTTTTKLTLSHRGMKIGAESLAEAAVLVRDYIEAYNLGATAWYRKHGQDGARVHDATGTLVARISYNGRVWAPNGTEIVL